MQVHRKVEMNPKDVEPFIKANLTPTPRIDVLLIFKIP